MQICEYKTVRKRFRTTVFNRLNVKKLILWSSSFLNPSRAMEIPVQALDSLGRCLPVGLGESRGPPVRP